MFRVYLQYLVDNKISFGFVIRLGYARGCRYLSFLLRGYGGMAVSNSKQNNGMNKRRGLVIMRAAHRATSSVKLLAALALLGAGARMAKGATTAYWEAYDHTTNFDTAGDWTAAYAPMPGGSGWSTPSALSGLNFWIAPLELDPRVGGGELPVHPFLFGIPFGFPRGDLVAKNGRVANHLAETLPGQDVKLKFGDIPPTAVLGGVDHFPPCHQAADLGRRERGV